MANEAARNEDHSESESDDDAAPEAAVQDVEIRLRIQGFEEAQVKIRMRDQKTGTFLLVQDEKIRYLSWVGIADPHSQYEMRICGHHAEIPMADHAHVLDYSPNLATDTVVVIQRII